MSLHIKIDPRSEDVYYLILTGMIDGDTSQQLETMLRSFDNKKLKALLLDMAEIDYISSAGIRVILWAQKYFKDKGTHFAMVCLKPKVEKIFETVKLMPILDIYNDIATADRYIDEIIKEKMKED